MTLGPPPAATRTVLGVPVEEGRVPDPWDAQIVVAGVLWADEDAFLLRQPGASVYVSREAGVVVEASSPEQRLAHDYLVYGTASRVLLMQRRTFPLHACVVRSPTGLTVAVSGDSMAGKSTTALELVRRGWTYCGDDIVEITASEAGVTATPVDRPIHLSDLAASRLDGDPSLGRPLPGSTKRVYSLVADRRAARLDVVADLLPRANTSVGSRRVSASQAVPLLAAHGDPYGVCHLSGHRTAYVRWACALAAAVPVFELVRPSTGESVDQVCDELEDVVTSHDH